MKKETTNTFEGGLIKDLHPLTTPNNVLTDALNATLITYNGNENILLNDMGNGKIETAKLPVGYVPVGMKEHGGIVYVAAYNPETKRGQVGSFPSPQLLWEDEGWSVNAPSNLITTPSISSSNFYNGNHILNEIVKQELFKTEDGTARIFHPGDKFIIGFPAKSTIAPDVAAGYVSILLGVIKSDGSIEIMRTWSKDSSGDFLYGASDNNAALKTLILNNNSNVLVFDASSSGSMILIVNLHTLDTFNLFREYELITENESEKILVSFTGEATRDGLVLKSSDDFLGLIDATLQSETHNPIVKKVATSIIGANTTGTYTIYPTVPFGIVDRMKKQVTINYSKIKTDEDTFGEWRFFVTDSYVKIGWSYDFYNLKKDKEIEYIKMYFHKLEDGYRANHDGVVSFEFLKESFNGNFEDYISISDTGLKLKTVYIVEIVRKFKDVPGTTYIEEIICFKMLYLSKLYNSMYNSFFNNEAIGVSGRVSNPEENGQYTCLNDLVVGINLEHELITNLEGSRVKVKTPLDLDLPADYINLSDLNSKYYVNEISESALLEITDTNKHYVTKIKNTYDCTLKVKGNLTGNLLDYIGTPNEKLIIEEILKACTISNKSINYRGENNQLEWYKSTESYVVDYHDNPGFNSEALASYSVTDLVLSISNLIPSDYRFMSGKMSEMNTITYPSKGLRPILAAEYTADKKNKIAPYWNTTEPRCISGDADSRETIFHSSKLGENGQIIEGPDAGGGIDDGGLQTASNYMNNPMTNIFVGMNGDAAEMEFRFLQKRGDKLPMIHEFGLGDAENGDYEGNNGGHFLKKQSDNYAIACWKFTDGLTHFVNLATAKTIGDRKANNDYPRVDIILKCLLSLIFVVTGITRSASYITTDDRFYAYLKGITDMHFTLLYDPTHTITENGPSVSTLLDDIMLIEDPSTLEMHPLTWYLTNKWNWNSGTEKINIVTQQGPIELDLKNLIPSVGIALPFNNDNELTIDVELPDYYDLDSLLGYYMGASYSKADNNEDGYNVLEIYLLDPAHLNDNKLLCTSGDGTAIKARADGIVTWSGVPKCIPLTSDSKDLYIYKWNNSDNTRIKFDDFYDHFETRAKLDLWIDVSEEEDNELLAIPGDSTIGKWTNASEDPAPDMYYKVLYSSDISVYKNSLITQLIF